MILNQLQVRIPCSTAAPTAAPVRGRPSLAATQRCLMRGLVLGLLTWLVCGLIAGCEEDTTPLQLADLTADEHLYLERVVQLERAKAVALVDRETGLALLDSLAADWGDSSLAETKTLVPSEPKRSAAVADLLLRILAAENDSLLHAPRPDRLAAPLPDPTTFQADDDTPSGSD